MVITGVLVGVRFFMDSAGQVIKVSLCIQAVSVKRSVFGADSKLFSESGG